MNACESWGAEPSGSMRGRSAGGGGTPGVQHRTPEEDKCLWNSVARRRPPGGRLSYPQVAVTGPPNPAP